MALEHKLWDHAFCLSGLISLKEQRRVIGLFSSQKVATESLSKFYTAVYDTPFQDCELKIETACQSISELLCGESKMCNDGILIIGDRMLKKAAWKGLRIRRLPQLVRDTLRVR